MLGHIRVLALELRANLILEEDVGRGGTLGGIRVLGLFHRATFLLFAVFIWILGLCFALAFSRGRCSGGGKGKELFGVGDGGVQPWRHHVEGRGTVEVNVAMRKHLGELVRNSGTVAHSLSDGAEAADELGKKGEGR